jgi:hypothetical protein
VRANQIAAELAPVIAELRAAGITSKKGIAKALCSLLTNGAPFLRTTKGPVENRHHPCSPLLPGLTGYHRPMKDTQTIAAELSTPERLLLFCVASDIELEAGVTRSTIAAMIIRGLIQRDPLGRLSLTKQGRDTLAALLRMVVSLVG